MAISEELLSIMICPDCSGKLEDRDAALVCVECGLHYPVRDGIPVMLIEESYRPGDESE